MSSCIPAAVETKGDGWAKHVKKSEVYKLLSIFFTDLLFSSK